MLLKWLAERQDTTEGRRTTREQQEAAEIARDREKLNERTNSWIARLEEDNKRLRGAIENRDDEIAALGRYLTDLRWYAWTLRGLMREARHIAQAQQRMMPQPNAIPPIVWQEEPVEPPMIQPPGE